MQEKERTTLVSAPASEPITPAEAKEFCRVDLSLEDDLFATLIQDARERAERVTSRQIITASWKLILDWFPCEVRLPKPPLQSITSIVYVDGNGDSQTLAASRYQVDTAGEPGRVMPAVGYSWPGTRTQYNAVEITFVAGYGAAAAVPAGLKRALLNAVAHCYDRRGEAVDEEWLDSLFFPYWCGSY